MGEERCRDCRSWEEEMYWTHFHCLHFSQFLRPGFDRQLAIPEKFSETLKRKLPDIVTLRSPSGATWQVRLTSINDILFFNDGWQDFVKAHFLKENDLLIFKYNGGLQFDVLMFDGQSMCEKAASYFVRKCNNRGCSQCQTPTKAVESSVEVVFASPESVAGGSHKGKSTNTNINSIPLGIPLGQPVDSVSKKRGRRGVILVKHNRTRQSAKHKKPLTCAEEMEAKDDDTDIQLVDNSEIENEPLSSSPEKGMKYVSNRRPVTEQEKQNALQMAQAAVTDDGFIAIMKPTHVYKRFYMSIPSAWLNEHLCSLEHQDMILRSNGNTWRSRFYYHRARNSGGLTAGWKNFAVDNNLHEFDVCVFEPGTSDDNGSITLDVKIFPVVQEVTRLIPASKEAKIKLDQSVQA